MKPSHLIVGLGNPGDRYTETRHNIGWHVLDALAIAAFRPAAKFQAAVVMAPIASQPTLLAKPQTFMNNSGDVVLQLVNFYKFPLTAVWLVHDDIDLPLGSIRVSRNRSAAGHRGVASVIERLGSQDLVRFRIGIKPAASRRGSTERFVLQRFSAAESKLLPDVISLAAASIRDALTHGVEQSASAYNGRAAEPQKNSQTIVSPAPRTGGQRTASKRKI